MHCPKCGQHQISDETRFCSRCGLLLTEIARFVSMDGLAPISGKHNSSARLRGLKHGLFLLLLSFLFVPLAGIIALALEAETPIFPAIVAFLTVVGGALRMAYALLFESGEPGSADVLLAEKRRARELRWQRKTKGNLNAMPAGTSQPFYSAPEQGKWRDTNDLSRQPASVADNTTKLLRLEQEN